MTPAERRLHLGAAAVLSPSAAVELLPFGDGGSRAWLDAQQLIRTAPGLAGLTVSPAQPRTPPAPSSRS